MLILESQWIKSVLKATELPAGSKVLNFGSQRYTTIKKNQPWIIENVIDMAASKGMQIVNFDLIPGEGVDISGDLFEEPVFEKMKAYRFPMIFIFNVLEHVQDLPILCRRIEQLVDIGGILFITVPYHYPTHYDPIDNGFRPVPSEVAELFPLCSVIEEKIIVDDRFTAYLFRDLRRIVKYSLRLLTPFYRPKKWLSQLYLLPYLFKPFKVSGIVLKRVK